MPTLQTLLAADLSMLTVIAGCSVRLVSKAHRQAIFKSTQAKNIAIESSNIDGSQLEAISNHPPSVDSLTEQFHVRSSSENLIDQTDDLFSYDRQFLSGRNETFSLYSSPAESSFETSASASPKTSSVTWTDVTPDIAATAPATNAATIAVALLSAGDLYADPIDGVPFEPGEEVVLCDCGTGYRPSTRTWLAEHAGGACVQCHQILPTTLHILPGAPEEIELQMAS